MTSISTKWTPKKRDYISEHKQLNKTTNVTTTHPLGVIVTNKPQTATSSSSIIDPLSVKTTQAEIDPLSRALAAAITSKKDSTDEYSSTITDTFEPWSSKKGLILNQFITTKKISMTTAMNNTNDDSIIDNIKIADMTTTSERVKSRLEQLDAFEGGQQTQSLTQQEYINRINEMSKDMNQAWKNDQRVKTLKIAIQCCKLLADMNVMEFYPSKFCLITDLLDNFGKLVYTRLLEKSASSTGKIPDRVVPDLIPEPTRETARNWFYKIAIIRELLPRILIEAAILKCYNFLSTTHYRSALVQLVKMCRGIGDPLVAAYTRCYICRVTIDIDFKYREPIEIAFTDLCYSFHQINTTTVKNMYQSQKLTTSVYLSLYSPALDWIVQCLLHKLDENKMEKIINKTRSELNMLSGGVILNALLNTLPPSHVRSKVQQYIEMISECDEQYFPKSILYRSLGLSLLLSSPSSTPSDLQMLNSVWKVVTKFKEPSAYMACAEVWVELTSKEYTTRELNTMLGDIIKHLTPDRAFEEYYGKLHAIMIKLLSNIPDTASLFAMDKILPFLDLFQREHVRVDLFKSILYAFINKNPQEKTNDPVLIAAMMHCAKNVHDTLGALTNDDELREVSGLLSSLIRKVDYGKDVEQELKFCVEARGVFGYLDSVTITLIQKVNTLAVSTHRIVNGVHSTATSSFIRACMAFCYISIPSLEHPLTKLQLYTLCAQTSYLNQSLSQGDGFLKMAITLLSDFPKQIEIDGKLVSSDKHLYESITNIMSTLVVVPDNPDAGVLYLAHGLNNVINQMKCFDDTSETRVMLFMNMLCLISTQIQTFLPYHIPKIESNDTLYGNDENFLNEMHQRLSRICEQIIQTLKDLANTNPKRQSTLALEFFNRLIAHGDLNQPKCIKFAVNLWNLAQKNLNPDAQKLAKRILTHIEARSVHDQSFKRLSELISGTINDTSRLLSRSSSSSNFMQPLNATD
ncbi:unnamed protein product [Rotaria sp. Silwood1]|nr:unnamed protein product [Rotaria sp. Silwood1]CAF0839249.1 unnamed protein product [Rotaria sp. Silwood1]CAF3400661.1 unnamed protein product [Rotaria sp. Silwood1]CAF3404383.1 unnamed protein product [Rotaria sp. Silwood1]CAF4576290.1 unnamed protein product [Rotaria sp. Silwood1]